MNKLESRYKIIFFAVVVFFGIIVARLWVFQVSSRSVFPYVQAPIYAPVGERIIK